MALNFQIYSFKLRREVFATESAFFSVPIKKFYSRKRCIWTSYEMCRFGRFSVINKRKFGPINFCENTGSLETIFIRANCLLTIRRCIYYEQCRAIYLAEDVGVT